MTLKDIAALANVSVSTVSKALSDSFDISAETRQEILEIAARAGYFSQKKVIKSQNRSGHDLRIALICPEIISIHYAGIITAMTAELTKRGCKSIIFLSNFDQEHTAEVLQNCINDTGIAAVISLSYLPQLPETACTPLLLFQNNSQYSYIEMSVIAGITCAVDHLRARGHTRIGFAGETLTSGKLRDFRTVMQQRGLEVDKQAVFISAQRFEAAGREAADWFLSAGAAMPTAIVCGYDEIACGLIDTFEKNGIAVPRDVSVIGINNIPLSDYCFGGLTTVDLIEEDALCTAIADLLGDVSRKRYDVRRTYRMTPHLIVRATTCKL